MAGNYPLNIKRLVRQNDQYATAEHNVKEMVMGGQTTKWHEKGFQNASRAKLGNIQAGDTFQENMETLARDRIVPEPTLRDDIVNEIHAANKIVKMERSQRLKELFESERIQYEAELRSMGLALSRHTD